MLSQENTNTQINFHTTRQILTCQLSLRVDPGIGCLTCTKLKPANIQEKYTVIHYCVN